MRRTQVNWSKKVVYIYLNMANSSDRKFAEKLGNTEVTTLQFRGKNGKVFKQTQGYKKHQEIDKIIQEMIK